jgi:hypothetical protein
MSKSIFPNSKSFHPTLLETVKFKTGVSEEQIKALMDPKMLRILNKKTWFKSYYLI